jgi:hypothetical protein
MLALVRVVSSKALILLSIPTWGVGYLPHVMTKSKRDENFFGLIWLVRSPIRRALKMFKIAKIGQDLHPKRSRKRRSFDL